ncbi:contractile injection system tape measure protein [Psychroserpens sp. AS72]|uniref:contractile injection system tape measure protein n=1 Tax=Psychroserpens sp. AS72 TaxID=3135775 RepID=UPI00317C6533
MENTGLIIAHPFLTQLFNYLNYLDDKNQFKNEELQYRAVYLLHYIATEENSDIDEADLSMSKILTGLLIEDSIPSNIVLTENEKNYANEVLQVIISKWDKLGSTSNDGLRNTFIKRNGILKKRDEAYQLTIETSGTDILLDYIPWNIKLIKWPWFEQLIYISWR